MAIVQKRFGGCLAAQSSGDGGRAAQRVRRAPSVKGGASSTAWTLAPPAAPGPTTPAVVSRALSQALGLRARLDAPGCVCWYRAPRPPCRRSRSPSWALPTFSSRAAAPTRWRRRSTRFSARARRRRPTAADVILVASRAPADPATTAAAIAARRKDVHAFSNEQIVERFNENGFAYFRQISFVLSTITLGFAFLLVATLLTVSVNQRLGQVAALRALGVPRHRIAATLVWESALLVGAGGLLSLPIGWTAGAPTRSHPPRHAEYSRRACTSSCSSRASRCGISGCSRRRASLAVVYPVWVATRLPIAATLRFETVS